MGQSGIRIRHADSAYASGEIVPNTAIKATLMVSKSEIEMRWIEAWSDLFEIAADSNDVQCLLPDGQIVDIEACKGWLQDAVYNGFLVSVQRGWVLGRQGAVISRSPAP